MFATLTRSLTYAYRGLLLWDRRRIALAVSAAIAAAGLIGLATVLIPNALFARDIPPVWWNYPVWVLMSILLGLLMATYVRDSASAEGSEGGRSKSRTGLFGSLGGMLGWFAVGCPVCNKIALLILGYTGALTYFTPLQPILAVLSVAMLSVALVVRLKGQYSCPLPSPERSLRT